MSLSWLHRVSADKWVDMRTRKTMSGEDILLYVMSHEDDEENNFLLEQNAGIKSLKGKISMMKGYCGRVRLISEQRLIRKSDKLGRDDEIIEVINELPERLQREISKVSEQYSAIANSLDRTYPQRLFSAPDISMDEEEYQQLLEDATSKFKNLERYYLVDTPLIGGEQPYKEKYANALKIYFEDFSKKYETFEKLIKKLDLFIRIINSRLSFKKIRISKERRLEVIDIDAEDKQLELTQLSSGEKQEIVLFYELIFATQPGTLLLLDEPEISLHISWQNKFMDDLLYSNPRIFHYDYSCMEMTAVADDKVFRNFAIECYHGSMNPFELRLFVLKELSWLSCMKKLNFERDCDIKFEKLPFDNFVLQTSVPLNEAVLSELKSRNPGKIPNGMVNDAMDLCGNISSLSEYLAITQGHDFISLFHAVCSKVHTQRKQYSIQTIALSLRCSYNEAAFRTTDLDSAMQRYSSSACIYFLNC